MRAGAKVADTSLLDAPAPIVLETDDMEIGLNKAPDSSKGDPSWQARRSSAMSTVDEEGGQVSALSLPLL